MDAADDIRFDYVASLQLARRLWSLADTLNELRINRHDKAAAALSDWLGAYGTQFGQRIDAENQTAFGIANDLYLAAEQWAARWAEAMNEQNSINFAREVKRVEDDRNLAEDIWGGIVGHDDLPPEPPTIDVPKSPGFYATGSLTRY